MTNSRAKGARGEREARDVVRKHWKAPDCIRAAQANGAFSADLLNALRDAHVEVKYYAKIGAFRFFEQAERDAQPQELPILLMRETGVKKWLVAFRIEDTEEFCRRIDENYQARQSTGEDPKPPEAVGRDIED